MFGMLNLSSYSVGAFIADLSFIEHFYVMRLFVAVRPLFLLKS